MNNILEYKGYKGTVEYSSEDNVLFGKVIGIKSLISYEGTGVEELKTDFCEAVDEYIEYCKENNVDPEKTYKGSLNVRFSPETHRKASLIALSEHISLNQFIENSVNEKIASYNIPVDLTK